MPDVQRCPNPDCGRIWPDDWEGYTWYPCRCGRAASISGVASVSPRVRDTFKGDPTMDCERGESPITSDKPGEPICEQCGERGAVLLTLVDAKRWCDECWRWRWAE